MTFADLRGRSGFAAMVSAGLLGMVVVAGCASDPREGYSFSSTYRADVKSIAVPIWNNTTQQYGLENELTAAIVSELRKSTPYKVVSGDSAQTVLAGSIVGVSLARLSVGRDTGLSEDIATIITVEFTWKDARSGKMLAARKNFAASERFIPARGVGERLETGINGAVQRMARDVVAELRAGL